MSVWNPWHGCTRLSSGCKGCVVFRVDAAHGRNTELVRKTRAFDLPVRKDRNREYKLQPEDGLVETCCMSDFFHPDADPWREEAWKMMKARPDLTFFITTKRPERFHVSLPEDWGCGYENVVIGCSCESQYTADRRLLNIERYLKKHSAEIEEVSCGGETGEDARELDYAWVIGMHLQCVKYDVPFRFRRTGTHFRRGGKLYTIEKEEQELQAVKANINYRI